MQRLADEASNFAQGLRSHYGVDLWMIGPSYGSEHAPAIVTIESIVVPKENRRQGVGSNVMFDVIRWADQNNYILALTPSSDFGGKVPKLRKFYKQFGFVRNLGRNKDFRTARAMIRYPKKKKTGVAEETEMSLRSKLVKLAYENPKLRSDLLPFIKKAIVLQRYEPQRIKAIRQIAYRKAKDPFLKQWLVDDPKGTWWKQAEELLDESAEKAAKLGLSEDQVNQEVANVLLVLGLQARINVAKRRKSAYSFDPDQERLYNHIVLNAVNQGRYYPKKDVRGAVDQATREEVANAIGALHEDAKIIVKSAVSRLEKRWGHSEEEERRLRQWRRETEDVLFASRLAYSRLDPDQERLLEEVYTTASNYGEFYPKFPTKAVIKAIKEVVAYKSKDIRSDAMKVKTEAIKEVARQWAMR